jgi:acetylglutamate kinase
VDGVKDKAGAILRTLSAEQAGELIRDGVATGGMQAKLEAALSALGKRVPEIVIAPGSYNNVLANLTSSADIGTRIC